MKEFRPDRRCSRPVEASLAHALQRSSAEPESLTNRHRECPFIDFLLLRRNEDYLLCPGIV